MPTAASTTISAMSIQPGAPQLIARNVNAAGAHTEPTVNPTLAAPWYSPRRSGSDSSDISPQLPADWNSSEPVTVTWPSHTRKIVVQPIVSCVTDTMRQDSTKKPALIRDA